MGWVILAQLETTAMFLCIRIRSETKEPLYVRVYIRVFFSFHSWKVKVTNKKQTKKITRLMYVLNLGCDPLSPASPPPSSVRLFRCPVALMISQRLIEQGSVLVQYQFFFFSRTGACPIFFWGFSAVPPPRAASFTSFFRYPLALV